MSADHDVVMYVTKVCPYCSQAERYLRQIGLSNIKKIYVDEDDSLRQEVIDKTGMKTVPQIFIDGHHIGGHSDLVSKHKSGELSNFLE